MVTIADACSRQRTITFRTLTPSKKPSLQTYRPRIMYHASDFVNKLAELSLVVNDKAWRIFGVALWDEIVLYDAWSHLKRSNHRSFWAIHSADARKLSCLRHGWGSNSHPIVPTDRRLDSQQDLFPWEQSRIIFWQDQLYYLEHLHPRKNHLRPPASIELKSLAEGWWPNGKDLPKALRYSVAAQILVAEPNTTFLVTTSYSLVWLSLTVSISSSSWIKDEAGNRCVPNWTPTPPPLLAHQQSAERLLQLWQK